MGVYTFVCRNTGGEWTAKQHSGELEASAATPYALQRALVAAASAADSASGFQSSFSMVTPTSAVFQVCSSTPPSRPPGSNVYTIYCILMVDVDAKVSVFVSDLVLFGSINRSHLVIAPV